jgi:hypothetical protein
MKEERVRVADGVTLLLFPWDQSPYCLPNVYLPDCLPNVGHPYCLPVCLPDDQNSNYNWLYVEPYCRPDNCPDCFPDDHPSTVFAIDYPTGRVNLFF